jgi:predicted dehydrogenase
MGLPVKLIQVGLGPWGRDWAANVLPHTGVELVASVDTNAAVLPPERGFTSLAAALAATDADAVLATVAINAHLPVALEALRAGKHVLLEKPFAPTLAQARSILDLATARGVLLSIAENYRYFPAVRVAGELVRNGELGAVNQVWVEFGKPRDPVDRTGDPIDSAVLVQLSIHHFDVMRAVLGQEPVRVGCRTWSPPWSNAPADVCAAATIEFDGGAVVTYTASMASRGPETPWVGRWRIEGERASITFADGVEVDGEPVPVPELTKPERAVLLDEFAAAIQDGGPVPNPGHDNIRSVALMDAAVESAATGRVVTLG